MDKTKKRVREHAAKHGMSYQAAWNQLEGGKQPPGPLEFWDWMDHVNGPGRSRCLTIADVTGLEPGTMLPLLIMDRNLCDHVYPRPRHALRPPRAAQEFFGMSRDGAVYTHGAGLTGKMLWGWDDRAQHADEEFAFEVEYSPNRWHPLVDGRLPTREWFRERFGVVGELDEMLEEDYPGMDFGRRWEDMPPTTRVGWRGPAMRWDRLPEMPGVFARIDLERLMIEGVMPSIRSVLGTNHDRPMWLQHTSDGWQLAVQDLTEEERREMGRLFADVDVVRGESRVKKFRKRASRETRRKILVDYLATPEGRRKMAATMRTPVRTRVALDGPGGALSVAVGMLEVMGGDAEDGIREVLSMVEWPEGVEPVTYEQAAEHLAAREQAEVEDDIERAELALALGQDEVELDDDIERAELALALGQDEVELDDQFGRHLDGSMTDAQRDTALATAREMTGKGPGLRTLAQLLQSEVEAFLREEDPGISGEARRSLLGDTLRRVAEDAGLSRDAVEGILGHLMWPDGADPLTADEVLGV